MRAASAIVLIISLASVLLMSACSGPRAFHLRKNINLPAQYQSVYLDGLAFEAEFKRYLEEALQEAGGKLVESPKMAQSRIAISHFEEGKRVIAYTKERKAREYLLFLRLEYALSEPATTEVATAAPRHRINIDRTYLYDSDFALGKAEEESEVKKALYREAARLILLRLRYAK